MFNFVCMDISNQFNIFTVGADPKKSLIALNSYRNSLPKRGMTKLYVKYVFIFALSKVFHTDFMYVLSSSFNVSIF